MLLQFENVQKMSMLLLFFALFHASYANLLNDTSPDEFNVTCTARKIVQNDTEENLTVSYFLDCDTNLTFSCEKEKGKV